MSDGFRGVLCQRGIAPDIAELAANAGTQVFRTAYRKWLEGNDETDLTTMTESVMLLLATIVPVARSPRGRRQAAATRLP
jgi:hypothetical protein